MFMFSSEMKGFISFEIDSLHAFCRNITVDEMFMFSSEMKGFISFEIDSLHAFCRMGRRTDGGALRAGKLQTKFNFLCEFYVQIQEGNASFCELKCQLGHNLSKSARIKLRFCTLTARKKLNVFCLDRFARYRRKKFTFL